MEPKIIFVVGNSRSGTTMLSRILGLSATAFSFNELHFFEQMWQPVLPVHVIDSSSAENIVARLIAVQRDGYFEDARFDKYKAEAAQIIALRPVEWTPPKAFAAFVEYETQLHGKNIPVEQTPRNLYYIRIILDIFPEARIINIVRDPRAVLSSQKNRWRRREYSETQNISLFQEFRAWVNYHPITISLMWNAGVNAYQALAQDPRLATLRFEDLLSDPEHQVRALCDFSGLRYSPDMLNVPQVGSSLRPDSPATIGIDRNAGEHWRGNLTSTELWLCQNVTSKLLERNKYAVEKVKLNLMMLVFYYFSFFIKGLMSFLINIPRTRNPIQSVLRRLGLK